MTRKIRRSKKNIELYVCPHCWNQLNKCTCEYYPPWKLIYIDTSIQEVCRILNTKGYTTTSSCESHFGYNPNLYVSFLIDYRLRQEYGTPEGFKWEEHNTSLVYVNKAKTKEEFEQNKFDRLLILKEWTENLPNINFNSKAES